MKRKAYFLLTLLIIVLAFSQIIYAQQTNTIPDYQLTAQIGRGTIEQLHFSSDNTQLAAMTARGIWIYEASNLNTTPRLFAPDGMNTLLTDSMAINPTFTLVAGVNESGHVILWDVATEDVIYHFEDNYFTGLRLLFSPDGNYLAAISPESWAIWNVIDGTTRQDNFSDVMFPPVMNIHQIAFNQSGTELGVMASSPGGHTIQNHYQIIDTGTGELIHSFDVHTVPYTDPLIGYLTFGDENPPMMLVSDERGDLRYATVTITQSDYPEYDGYGTVVQIPFSNSPTVHSFSPDNSLFAITGRTGDLRIWDMNIAVEHPPCPEPSSLRPESASAVDYDGCDSAWRALRTKTDAHRIQTLFDANETTRLINLQEGEYASIDGQWSIFVRPDRENSINLTHQDERELQLQLPDDLYLNYPADIFITDNRIIIVWSGAHNRDFVGEGFIIVWNIDPESIIQEARSVTEAHGQNPIRDTAINADNTQLLTTSHDGITRIWDIDTMTNEIVIESDMIFIDVAFGDDGETIFTLGQDGIIYVWTTSQP